MFIFSKDSDDDESYTTLTLGAVLSSSLHLNQALLKIIIKGEVVMGNIQDLPRTDVFCLDLHMHFISTTPSR